MAAEHHNRTPTELVTRPARFFVAALNADGSTADSFQPNMAREWREEVRWMVRDFIKQAKRNGQTTCIRRVPA